MPKGLKITNRTGHVLYDSAWIVGVDYDEDEFEDEDPVSESEEEQDEEADPESKEEEEEEEEDPNPTTVKDSMQRTRSGRVSKPHDVLTYDECKTQYSKSHLQTQAHEQENYSLESAQVIAVMMCHFNIKFGSLTDKEMHHFVHTYSLKAGLKKFQECGKTAAMSEMSQLHD